MTDRDLLLQHFRKTRNDSEIFCEPLAHDDYNLQAIAETSPAKWHLAHTSWFFETFILKAYESSFTTFDDSYEVLFNSYYNSVGEQFPRAQRGLISSPSVDEIYAYRADITERVVKLITDSNEKLWLKIKPLLELGINHEQQHQELFFTDLLFNLYQNPKHKCYSGKIREEPNNSIYQSQWVKFEPGLIEVGANSESNYFTFDNESPRHKYWLEPFECSDSLVTNREFLEFITNGGYQNPLLWLADGWHIVNQESWEHPLYWVQKGDDWYQYTLHGLIPLELDAPISHVSGYEADAYARWKECRMLTEFEWEYVANTSLQEGGAIDGTFIDTNALLPVAPGRNSILDKGLDKGKHKKEDRNVHQLFGELWQWTSSAYQPYPGFKEVKGAIGEYNGKFMCNQMVLRGGSCVTSRTHIRTTYRNFFYPETRWQFSGIRLARSIN